MRHSLSPPAIATLDLRSLALFRFCLGLVVSLDCWARLADVGAFYSDAGVLPRALLLPGDHPQFWSLAYLHGSALFQGALLIIGALAAAAFAFGYRTRRALLLSWVIVVSLHYRNPLVLIGGDSLMVCLLFWSMFVPVAARWSIDAALSPTPPPGDHRHRSWGGAALLLQVLSVYFFTAAFKHDPAWWPEGTAVYYALELDRYTLPLGQALRDYPQLLRGLSYAVYGLEWLAPLLVLSPVATQTLRHLVFAALALMHIGFLFTLAIGHFPWVSLCSLTILLGPALWDRLGRRAPRARPLRIYYDEDCGFCLRACLILRQLLILPPDTQILPAQHTPRARALMEAQWSWVVIDADDAAHLKWAAMVALIRDSRLLGWSHRLWAWQGWTRAGDAVYDLVATHRGRIGALSVPLLARRELPGPPGPLATVLVASLMAMTLAWNLATVGWLPAGLMQALAPPLRLLRLDQSWNMFAPKPMTDDGWFVMPGRLEDGRSVNLMDGVIGPVRYDKPRVVATEQFTNIRWSSYLGRLWLQRYAAHREPYARYRCREWNRGAPDGQRLQQFSIEYMLEVTPPPGGEPTVERRVIWRQQCLPGPALPGPDGEDVEGLDDGPEAG